MVDMKVIGWSELNRMMAKKNQRLRTGKDGRGILEEAKEGSYAYTYLEIKGKCPNRRDGTINRRPGK